MRISLSIWRKRDNAVIHSHNLVTVWHQNKKWLTEWKTEEVRGENFVACFSFSCLVWEALNHLTIKLNSLRDIWRDSGCRFQPQRAEWLLTHFQCTGTTANPLTAECLVCATFKDSTDDNERDAGLLCFQCGAHEWSCHQIKGKQSANMPAVRSAPTIWSLVLMYWQQLERLLKRSKTFVNSCGLRATYTPDDKNKWDEWHSSVFP